MGEFRGTYERPHVQSALSFSLPHKIGAFSEALNVFVKEGVNLSALESRPCKEFIDHFDFYCEFESPAGKEVLQRIVNALQEKASRVSILGSVEGADTPWFPQHISDLDRYTQKCLEFGEELDADHPGFRDETYRKRRAQIVKNAQSYRFGEPIPRVDYTETEIKTWGIVYGKLKSLFATHACKQQNNILPLLEQNCGYGEDNIPQLEDISKFLQRCTGWRLRPVAGLLSPRDFLNGLAFRVFHSTQYIRHHSKPLYTPEPDVCHELIGHVPLFADPSFADFSQLIGLASLGASDEDINKLATCYWFTVEFGLCKEGDDIKAFGAGLLSSFGELQYCLTDEPKKLPFEPATTCLQEYPITRYQPLYYVAESFQDAKNKLLEFTRTLSRPFDVRYNPYTQSVEILDSQDKLIRAATEIQTQLSTIISAMSRQKQ